nr:hypothetical protein [Streptomyces tsukubensis]
MSVAQVAGSAVAAIAAAVLASKLGVYGTIIGAGVVSVVATTGGTVFQHLFRRTGEQIREAAVQTKPKARQVPHVRAGDGSEVPGTFLAEPCTDRAEPYADGAEPYADHGAGNLPYAGKDGVPGPAGPPASAPPRHDATTVLPRARQGTGPDAGRSDIGRGGAGRDGVGRDGAGVDIQKTQMISALDGTRPLGAASVPVAGEDDRTRALRIPNPGSGAAGGGPGAEDDGATRLIPVTGQDIPGDQETPLLRGPVDGARAAASTRRLGRATDGPSEEFGASVTHGTRKRRRRGPLITAAIVFALSMAGITGYEVLSGHSLSGGDGSTIGRITHGNSGGSHQDQEPTTDPSGAPSDTNSPSDGATSPQDGGSGSPSGSPSPGQDESGSDSGSGSGQQKDDDTDPGSGTGTSEGKTPTPTPTPSDTGTSNDQGDDGQGSDGDQGEVQKQEVTPPST